MHKVYIYNRTYDLIGFITYDSVLVLFSFRICIVEEYLLQKFSFQLFLYFQRKLLLVNKYVNVVYILRWIIIR